MADTLNDRVAGSSVIIVISTLIDQVTYLNMHTAVRALNLSDASNDKETALDYQRIILYSLLFS